MSTPITPLLECIPNFSEGQNPKIIREIVKSIETVKGLEILHVDIGYSVNRSVVTFLGEPSAIIEGAFRGIKTAASLIDMSKQKGIHPRIGATDVCPLVPYRNLSKEEAIYWSKRLGKRVGEELQIPVYLYEWSAKENHRKLLADIRKGGYENMSVRIGSKGWEPDYGPIIFPPQTGATVIGARFFLIAFNIQLTTQRLDIAKKIACTLREKGAHLAKKNTGLKGVRAIGWYIPEYKEVQVSFNVTDFRITSLFELFEACKKEARAHNVQISGSELIGMIPMEAIENAGKEIIAVGKSRELKNPVKAAIEYLGLNNINPFLPEERIISLKSIL
ncbi:MAG: glutamate formimidoyltransferase [Saprospiraceae bacterium]|jgi:glutamate formiminotransferase/formiminotetrahydrofolate cyclodeaminase